MSYGNEEDLIHAEKTSQTRRDRRGPKKAAGRCPGLAGQIRRGCGPRDWHDQATDDRWRQEFGGLKSDQVKRMTRRAASANDLEAENARLRRVVSDMMLDQMILAEAARGNF